MMEKTMQINGMMCNHCKMTVEKALKAGENGISQVPSVLDGIFRIKISFAPHTFPRAS